MTLRYDEEEFAAVCRAAARGRMTATSYVAQAALATATASTPPVNETFTAALLELMAARTQVRRFGVNVNQAVRQLNATGCPPEWLPQIVSLTARAVDRLDQAAASITRQLR